jgi:predicted cobalt transporter CbtA
MTPIAWRATLLAGVMAGLLAGFAAGVWHLVATEPIIQRAIAIEATRRAASGAPSSDEVVSRPLQRAGLLFGFALYGVAWGALFGLLVWLLRRDTARSGMHQQAFALALAAYWAVGLFPLLKYPANPPGVGEAATVAYRQTLYVGFLVLSILGALLVAVAYRRLGRGVEVWQQRRARGAVAGLVYVAYAVLLAIGMPDNPDTVPMPAALVATFRWLSVAGVTVFWTVLGSLYVLLIARQGVSYDV